MKITPFKLVYFGRKNSGLCFTSTREGLKDVKGSRNCLEVEGAFLRAQH